MPEQGLITRGKQGTGSHIAQRVRNQDEVVGKGFGKGTRRTRQVWQGRQGACLVTPPAAAEAIPCHQKEKEPVQ